MARIRLIPIFFIVVVTLAALIGGWQAYQHFNLLNPLESKLKQIPGVQSLTISAGSNHVTIQLDSGSRLQNDDLQSTYDKIVTLTEDTLGSNVSITLLDHQNWDLTNAYESYKPSLFEGITKGNYMEMIANIVERAKSDHISARITMDKHYIFIQLSKGNYYLYDVVPYSLYQGGGSS